MRMAIHWAVFKANGRLILVDPKYTSQTCPICGCTSSSNRPSQAHFGCQKCGYTANADVVGATNVLKKSRTGSVRPCSELGNKTATGNRPFRRVLTRSEEESRVFIRREDVNSVHPPPMEPPKTDWTPKTQKHFVAYAILHFPKTSVSFKSSSAVVAQLDRVSGYEPEGRGFESCLPHHLIKSRRCKSIGGFIFCRATVFRASGDCRRPWREASDFFKFFLLFPFWHAMLSLLMFEGRRK